MDWIAALLIVLGNFALARKWTVGWYSSILGSLFMIVNFTVFAHNPAIVVLNIVFAAQGIYGIYQWKRGTPLATSKVSQ